MYLYCFSVEEDLATHALVEFIKEGCTAVVPIHRIVTTIKSLVEGLEEGESVNVLWSNRREYPAIYLLSGTSFFII